MWYLSLKEKGHKYLMDITGVASKTVIAKVARKELQRTLELQYMKTRMLFYQNCQIDFWISPIFNVDSKNIQHTSFSNPSKEKQRKNFALFGPI